ncbi:MAG: entericidin [Marivibrio sp.]
MTTRTPHPLLNLVLAALFALGLAACENTIEGAGEDIEEMGDEVEEAT